MKKERTIGLSPKSTSPLSPLPIYGQRFVSDLFFVELCPKQPYQVQYQSKYHILGFALESQQGYHSFASDRITPFHAPANTFIWRW